VAATTSRAGRDLALLIVPEGTLADAGVCGDVLAGAAIEKHFMI
jgi:hypothetical protein